MQHVFPNFDAAMKKSRDAYSAALSSHEIPGGDDHVGMAISLLEAGYIGRTADELIAQADAYLIDGNAGGHNDAVGGGLMQSAALIEYFRSRLTHFYINT